ncbi:glycoside hydrolase family 26 protein [Streptomyces sp. NPDC091292]|uniref:glycoside hydrolase family 26 protein n=1 Tax=Streptomyces sp. NPDC091292 TaxID=3365991 RepID=UPI0038010C58
MSRPLGPSCPQVRAVASPRAVRRPSLRRPLLVVLASALALTGCSGSGSGDDGRPAVSSSAPTRGSGQGEPSASATPPPGTAAQRLIPTSGRYFGISTLKTPWSPAETDAVARRAGKQPNLLEYFVKWNEGYRRGAVDEAYKQGGVPLLTWEPWASVEAGNDQPDYALAEIADGRHDAYVKRFAEDVRAHGRPLILRFAHEMNGTWFPWAENTNGNDAGSYVKAWRHVHDLFTQAGVRNVVWQWSPNILRTIEKTRLRPLYPGDAYVDLVGLSGYRKYEKRAADVFDPALSEIRAFTKRPVLISETGARPGKDKAAWIADFFGWLRGRPEVIGFVWFERSPEHGGKQDWRFAETPGTQRAFRGGLAGLELADAPDGEPVPSKEPE